jgi:hypothetical protein
VNRVDLIDLDHKHISSINATYDDECVYGASLPSSGRSETTVCVCVCVCARACVCVCACVCVFPLSCFHARVTSLIFGFPFVKQCVTFCYRL